jgi:hypothetical protein
MQRLMPLEQSIVVIAQPDAEADASAHYTGSHYCCAHYQSPDGAEPCAAYW